MSTTNEFREALDEWELLVGSHLNNLLASARISDYRRFEIRKIILMETLERLDDSLHNYYFNQKDLLTPILDHVKESVDVAMQKYEVYSTGTPYNRRKTDKEKKA